MVGGFVLEDSGTLRSSMRGLLITTGIILFHEVCLVFRIFLSVPILLALQPGLIRSDLCWDSPAVSRYPRLRAAI